MYFVLFAALLLAAPLHGKEASASLPALQTLDAVTDECAQMDMLIKASEDNLARQKRVKTLLEEYKKLEKACIEKPNNTPMLFKMADAGKKLSEAIDENYLNDYFKPSFIDDLKKLKSIADKKNIPPAR